MNDLKGDISSSVKIFSDLDKIRAEFNPPATVPPPILATSLRPDIVIIFENDIFLLELSFNKLTIWPLSSTKKNLNNTECNILASDLELIGWTVSYDAIEIGALNHFAKDSCDALEMSSLLNKSLKLKRF